MRAPKANLCLRLFLALCSSALGYAQEDASWRVVRSADELEGLHVAPASNPLNKALHDAAEYVGRFHLPPHAEGWKTRRKHVEAEFRKAIGLDPLPPRSPLNARVLRIHDFGEYVIENVIFYSRPETPVPANIYRPKNVGGRRLPAVLSVLGHWLREGKAAAQNQALAARLAQLGFIVMTYDAIGHGERNHAGNTHHHAGYALLPLGETVAGWMVWDSIRAADYLSERPDVDSNRIGIAGNSGGGLNTLFTSALEPRFKAAAVAGYVFEFQSWMKYGGRHCTCVYLPGLYRSMEWFEIGGLSAPRALLMLQGTRDSIFPVTSARRAGRATESLYDLLGIRNLARLDLIPNEPHGLSKPFREAMYGWMRQHLSAQGDGSPVAEGEIATLPVTDRRLLCDLDGTLLKEAPSIVELARRKAAELSRRSVPREVRFDFVKRLTAPREPELDMQRARIMETAKQPEGTREKLVFSSEIGEYIPAILWRSVNPKPRVVVIADAAGKAAVAQSALVAPLLAQGYAVLAPDLRGRGETMGSRGAPGRTNNYHLVSHSIMWGRPIAGRRAFDLRRTIDYLETRNDLSTSGLTVVGLSDDALPALLAAVTDPRISRVACSGYDLTFHTQMISAPGATIDDVLRVWNSSAMNDGWLNDGKHQADTGSVLPGVLQVLDLPDLAEFIRDRPVLFTAARNMDSASTEHKSKWLSNLSEANRRWFRPDHALTADLLLEWLSAETR